MSEDSSNNSSMSGSDNGDNNDVELFPYPSTVLAIDEVGAFKTSQKVTVNGVPNTMVVEKVQVGTRNDGATDYVDAIKHPIFGTYNGEVVIRGFHVSEKKMVKCIRYGGPVESGQEDYDTDAYTYHPVRTLYVDARWMFRHYELETVEYMLNMRVPTTSWYGVYRGVYGKDPSFVTTFQP